MSGLGSFRENYVFSGTFNRFQKGLLIKSNDIFLKFDFINFASKMDASARFLEAHMRINNEWSPGDRTWHFARFN